MPEVNYSPDPRTLPIEEFVPDISADGAGVTSGAYIDPNGFVSGSEGDIYHSAISLGGDGTIWVKVSSGTGNTGWE
jgi:hypothetical protein